MRARSTKIACAVATALAIVAQVFTAGCRHGPPGTDGPRLNPRLMGADSPAEIELMIRGSFAERCSPKEISDGCVMYQVTNGPTHWVFVLAANGPRGLGMLNLYCYQQEAPSNWLLRGYVPLLTNFYTNGADRKLHFLKNDDHLDVEFRDVPVFTTASRKKLIDSPHER